MFTRLVFSLFIFVFLVGCSAKNQKSKADNRLELRQESQNQTKLAFVPKIPSSMEFCGETIQFDDFDKKERLDLELIVNANYHSSTIQILKKANRYFPDIEKAIRKARLPADLKYIAVIESALKPTVTSPAQARGLWQFMQPTAKEYGLEVNNQIDERCHVSKSTTAAMKYFASSYRKFNDWKLAITSYNCGVAGLQQQIEQQQTNHLFDLYLNKETSRYYFRALALKLIMENPSDYGFELSQDDLYDPIPTKSIKVNSTIDDLTKWAKKQGTSYRKLKVLNPWLISNKLTIKNQSYFIKIPAE